MPLNGIAKIAESARRGKLVAVIGTGVSIGLTDGTIPALSWKGLILDGLAFGVRREKVTKVQESAYQGHLESKELDELLTAAEFMGRRLDSPHGLLYQRWFENVFDGVAPSNSGMESAVRALRAAGVRLCTLNYDTLLESVTNLPTINLAETKKVAAWVRGDIKGILHLHGSWNDPATCILGIRDYQTTLGNEVRDLIQRSLASFERLLFIGCGDTFGDPNFSALIAWLKENMKTAPLDHFALVTDGEVARRDADTNWHGFVDPIGYGAKHSDLSTFLLKHFAAPAPMAAPVKTAAKVIWAIPLPTHTFQDRPDLIAQIDGSLKKGVTALTALHGLGGIGKTQLARRYAQERHERYKLGVWIEAETEVSLMSSLSALAPLLGVPVEQDQKAMAARMLNELSTHEPWLVIFDNAESADALRPYVERLSGNGHVLITSRNEQWDGLASTVSVTQWSVEESTRFLLERTKQSDRAAAKGLAGDLDGLVLALEHAAAYMLAGDGMTLAEYRRVWREKLKWGAKEHSYPNSVAAALGLSIEAVASKSPAAYELLCLFAWLAPDLIPRKELLEAGAEELPKVLAKAFEDHDVWGEVIGTLGSYSLLKREGGDGVVTGYSIHRVVQEVMRDRMGSDEKRAMWLAAACNVVDAAFPGNSMEPKFWAASELLLPHARAIREHVRVATAPVSLGRLLNEASIYLRARGLYTEARDFQELALESWVAWLGEDHPNVAIARSNLAIAFRRLGKLAEARRQIELALESDLQHLGPNHPNIAIRRSNLAIILGDLGELAEARKQIELALDSDSRQLGPDHPNVAIHRSNLAIILPKLGEHAEARKQIELALESALCQLGPEHPSVAIRRSNLAGILSNLGEYAESRKQIELALESDLRQLGRNHPYVATDRQILAGVLCHLGEREAALREIDLALEIFRTTLPPGHPETRNAEGWRKTILGEE
jgi:tetratricopeptide (TPR) repeat protein